MKVVAVPIVIGSLQIHVAKGRKWSVVEHALLDTLCQKASTATELSQVSKLPIRMVVEAMINLMRVGWVELQSDRLAERFVATAGGKANVGRDDLPSVTRLVRRHVRYAVDQITGSVLNYRELDFVWRARLADISYDAKLEPTVDLPPASQVKIVSSLLYEDEEFRGLVPGSARPGAGYALAAVSEAGVNGLPGASARLIHVVNEAAKGRTESQIRLALEQAEPLLPMTTEVPINFIADKDLVLGGEEHKARILDAIDRSAARIVIHSTFIGEQPPKEIVDHLLSAARRGVHVDILWGKSDVPGVENATRKAGIAIAAQAEAEKLGAFLRVHPFPTDSHAKILVADDGKGNFISAVGSCNWLSTSYKSYEASVFIRDELFAGEVMSALAQMGLSGTGWSGGIVGSLAGLAANIKKSAVQRGGRRATARLVLATEHADYILRARDEAKSFIIIGSHRLGRSARNLSVVPTRVAAEVNGINAVLYYGRLSDGVTTEEATNLRLNPGAPTMKVRQIHDPRLHAKFLTWDDNDALLTSHNLLSADPGRYFSEVGVHIHCPSVGRYLREKLAFHLEQ